MMPELSHQLLGILFYKAAPVKKATLGRILTAEPEVINQAIEAADNLLAAGPFRLIVTESELELVTAPALAPLIESIRKDELKRDIGKAGAETLAVILYRGPIARAEIDRIRGVNSSFILRNLLVRGLIERQTEKGRSTFMVTTALLAQLGLTDRRQLPDWAAVMDKLDQFEKAQTTEV